VEILRNLYRRRLRTGLTVLGIAVGILSFTVMGAMAEKFNRLIDGGEAYFARRIAIHSVGGPLRLNLLGPEEIEVMKRTPGVRHVETQIMMALDETAGFELAPRFLVGINLPNFARAQLIAGEAARLRLARGSWWQPGDRGVTVLGSATAHKMNLDVGDILTARGMEFRVVGILEETLSVPDGWALIPEEDARTLLLADSALLREMGLDAVWTNAYALVDPGLGEEITETLARSLRRGYLLHSPEQLARAAGTASSLLNAAILGSAAIAVIVGALAVINTMFFAVSERTREIGIKKAIGGRPVGDPAGVPGRVARHRPPGRAAGARNRGGADRGPERVYGLRGNAGLPADPPAGPGFAGVRHPAERGGGGRAGSAGGQPRPRGGVAGLLDLRRARRCW